jgi:WD40 repeat protein
MISAAELKEEWRVHGLALAQFNMPLSDTLRTGLIIEPKINWLVLNGPGGGASLQFYSLNLKKHITQMDIVSRNVVSRVDKEPLPVVRVEKVVFSADGKYMATVDSALHAHGKCMHSLKFWKRTDVKWKQVEDTSSAGQEKSPYQLNSQVDRPHDNEVTSLVYHPSRHVVVTTSLDTTFKVWSLIQLPTAPSMNQKQLTKLPGKNNKAGGNKPPMVDVWQCRSAGSYRNHISRHAAFSSDGSLLGIAYGSAVTLWDPMSNALLSVLSHVPNDSEVQSFGFVPGTKYLVSHTHDTMFVWDLVSCSVWWSYQATVTALAFKNGASASVNPEFAVLLDMGLNSSNLQDLENTAICSGVTDSSDKEGKKGKKNSKKGGDANDDDSASVKYFMSGSAVVLFDPEGPKPKKVWYEDQEYDAFSFWNDGQRSNKEDVTIICINTYGEIVPLQYNQSSSRSRFF